MWYRRKRTWITWDGNYLLWLPPEYRPVESAVKKNRVGIGCGSGVVYVLNFRADILGNGENATTMRGQDIKSFQDSIQNFRMTGQNFIKIELLGF